MSDKEKEIDKSEDQPIKGRAEGTPAATRPTIATPTCPPVSENWNDSATTPSMTMTFFIYWIVPLFILAATSRYGVDTSVGTLPVDPTPPKSQQILKAANNKHLTGTTGSLDIMPRPSASPTPALAITEGYDLDSSAWPTAYRQTVATIVKRRPRWTHGPPRKEPLSPTVPNDMQQKQSPSSQKRESFAPRGSTSDPRRQQLIERIDQIRGAYEADPNDLFRAIDYADALRVFVMQIHDGGTYEKETIDLYKDIIAKLDSQRARAKALGESTHLAKDARVGRVSDELVLDYPSKSLDGLLCSVYTSLGKMYFMANMFERSAEAYSGCIDQIEPDYLDALNGRASTRIVLGQYESAGEDYLRVIRLDNERFFTDAFTGIARILEAKEEAVSGGWEAVLSLLYSLLQEYTDILDAQPGNEAMQMAAPALKRFHHALFTYHDRKTKNISEAWSHLEASHRYKLATLPIWNKGIELTKSLQIRQIFRPGFWPAGVGSDTRAPIFIIGFPRSGSTLLERVLDAHPSIVGTGENSVFNGRLEDIRNQIVQVSVSGQHDQLGPLTKRLGDEVVQEMRVRWERLTANSDSLEDAKPLRLVDKMLTNYYNVGFIHLLYPNALILHVMREPMDTLFSAFKHEFPSGTLEYTSDTEALAEMYRAYREVILHWDEVLPGRVTHVRYEDMVNNMPGVAKAVIKATGMSWDESVLDFHKKKHFVNTMSSTQVRKNVYKDAVKSWSRYEKDLKPLISLVKDLVDTEIVTTLPGYSVPNPGHSDEL